MRSIVPSDENPAASARRAHSTMPARSTPRTAFGSPMPTSTNEDSTDHHCRDATTAQTSAVPAACDRGMPAASARHDALASELDRAEVDAEQVTRLTELHERFAELLDGLGAGA